jgi:restriction endonuclease S subunit
MNSSWVVKKLGDLAEQITDGTHNSPNYVDAGIPMLDSKHVLDGFLIDDTAPEKFISIETDTLLSKRCKPRAGDILISSRGSIGKIAIVKKNQNFNIMGNMILIRLPESINRLFAAFYLFSKVSHFESIAKGVAQKGLYLNQIREYELPLPALHEQQRIVAILDQAFEGIAKARANTEQNLQNARALFESHLQSVFTQSSNNWQMKKLGDSSLVKIIDGDRGVNYPNKDDFSDEGYCLFLNTKNVRPNGFSFDTKMFISEQKDKLLRNGKLQRQDVILTTRGTIGNLAIYDESVEFDNVRINSGMLIFRPKPEQIYPSFLFEVFRSGIMKNQIARHVSGAAQPQLPIKTLIEFEIPVPNSLEQQKEIVRSVRAIEKETQRLEALYQRKIACLDELKKSLLQQAFAGEL